jgi:hypothetical protein
MSNPFTLLMVEVEKFASEEAIKTPNVWDDDSGDESGDETETESSAASTVTDPSCIEVVIFRDEPNAAERKKIKNTVRREKKKAQMKANKLVAEEEKTILLEQIAETEKKHAELMKAKAGMTFVHPDMSDSGSIGSAIDRIERMTSTWTDGERTCFYHLTNLNNGIPGSRWMGHLDNPSQVTFAMLEDIITEHNGLSPKLLCGWYKGKHRDCQDGVSTMNPLYANLHGIKWRGKNFAQTYGSEVCYERSNPWAQHLHVLEQWNNAPEICRFNGRCTDKNCTNDHPQGQNLIANICWHWQRGNCSRGASCGFDHPDLTGQSESVSDSASEYSVASTMSCAECSSQAAGYDDPTNGQFYCNGCWKAYGKTTSNSSSGSGKCPYNPMSAKAKDWYKKNGRV